MIAVSAYILAAVSNIQLWLPGIAVFRVGLLSALASVVFLAASGRREHQLRWTFTTPTVLIVGLLIWAALGVPFALHRGLAYAHVTGVFWRVVLLYVVMVMCVRGFRDVERLVYVYLFGVIGICGYAMIFAPMGAGEARVAHITSNLDPNDFAALAVTGFPLAVYGVSHAKGLLARLTSLVGVGLVSVGVVLSGSRGGLLAFLCAAGYLLARSTTIRLRYRVLSVVGAVAVAVAVGSDSYWDRMATILEPSKDYNVTAEVGRTQIWSRGLGYALQRPITGVGAANFGFAEGTLSSLARRAEFGVGVKLLAPHNSFVQVVAELGFPGLIALLATITLAYKGLSTGQIALQQRFPLRARALAEALAASMVGLLVGVFFLSHAYSALLYSVLALSVAYAKVGILENRAAQRANTRSK